MVSALVEDFRGQRFRPVVSDLVAAELAASRKRPRTHGGYADAKRALHQLGKELGRLNESAAHGLDEGLEETLTLHRLGIHDDPRRSLSTTNLIESVMAQIERKTQRVDHWRTSDQKQRWCAATLLQIEQQFRRVRGCKHFPLLQHALRPKLSPTIAAA